MSSPVQKENGHSPIAHPILEALARAPLTAGQHRILFVVIRATYGWSRKEAPISYSAFSAATGLTRKMVSRIVPELVAEGVLIRAADPSGSSSGVYRLQKDAREWGRYSVALVVPQGDPLQGDPSEGDPRQGDSTVVPQGDSDGSQAVANAGTSSAVKQKARGRGDKSPLCDRTFSYPEAFQAAWTAYPARSGGNNKRAAFRAWTATVKRGATEAQLQTATEHYHADVKRRGKLGTEYVKLAATFYGPDEHWREYLEAPRAARPSNSLSAHIMPYCPPPPEELEADRKVLELRRAG